MKKAALLSTLAFTLLATGAQYSFAEPLTDQQIIRKIVNKEFRMTNKDGFSARIELKGSGEAFLRGKRKAPKKDKGIWWVKKDTLCIKWTDYRDREVLCEAINPAGANTYKSDAGFTWKKI